jgi:mannan endo-1,4-beta-mannosidase
MKSVLALGLGLLSLAHAAPCGGAADPSAVPSADGSRFKIDGKTGYYAGSNAYWIGFLKNNKDIDTTLDHVAASGLKILRVWGFNDVAGEPKTGEIWFQKHSSSGSVINTGADGLQRLDYVVKSAESRGVKLIINFVNYWDDYGGMNAYVSAYGGTKQSWFTNSKAQAQYKKYISTVVARYANSNALFSWQLANEPRCQGCSTDVIYKWATEISAYIKSLDSKHMISIGDEGFGLAGQSSYPYGFSEGVDFVKNLAIKDISFGTIHMYPDSCALFLPFPPPQYLIANPCQ